MKRGTLEHPKTLELAATLKIPRAYAVGLLEGLFHWTAKYAPTGDLSRFSDATIARGMYWGGKPERAIRALVKCGWVDEAGDQKLLHDWSEHADQCVQKWLQRKDQRFADGSAPFSRTCGNPVRKPSGHGPDAGTPNAGQGPDAGTPNAGQGLDTGTPARANATATTNATATATTSERQRQWKELNEQQELRGLTFEQFIQATSNCPKAVLTPQAIEDIKTSAMMSGGIAKPGWWFEGCLSRLENKAEKKDAPAVVRPRALSMEEKYGTN
jgi:hypothetical protein